MKAFLSLLAVVIAAAVAGCATPDKGPFAWSQGWRKGEVLEVAKPDDMEQPRFYKCVREADPKELQSEFLVVRYLQMGRAKKTAVPAPASERFRTGDLVYVNLGGCHLPAVARMEK